MRLLIAGILTLAIFLLTCTYKTDHSFETTRHTIHYFEIIPDANTSIGFDSNTIYPSPILEREYDLPYRQTFEMYNFTHFKKNP